MMPIVPLTTGNVEIHTFPPPGVCRLLSREPTRDFVLDMFGLRPIDGVAVTRRSVNLPAVADNIQTKT